MTEPARAFGAVRRIAPAFTVLAATGSLSVAPSDESGDVGMALAVVPLAYGRSRERFATAAASQVQEVSWRL